MEKVNGTKIAGSKELKIEWPEPLEFSADVYGPECPVDALPDVLRKHVEEASASIGAPLGMLVAGDLAALASVCAGRARVCIGRTHSVPLNLYTICIADPSERKSPAIEASKEPLIELERELLEACMERLAENRARRAVAQQRMDHLKREASRAKDPGKRESLTQEMAETDRSMPAEVFPPRLHVDDCTIEALVQRLGEQDGRLALISDEGGTFVGICAGRYDATGSPNLDAILKSYDANSIRVDRKARDPVHVPHPVLNIALMIQPGLLDRIAAVADFSERGLLGRFLWVWPQSLVGSRLHVDRAIPRLVSQNYSHLLRRIHALPAASPRNCVQLRIEAASYEAWKQYHDRLETDQRSGGRLHCIRAWAGKHASRVARFAGHFHLARYAGAGHDIPEQIALEDVVAAIRIAEWFEAHALCVFGRLGADPKVVECKRILRWIRDGRTELFTRRDLHQARYRDRLDGEELQPYLDALESRGFIRRLRQPKGPGRPTVIYQVNPATHAQNAQKPQKQPSWGNSEGFEGSARARPNGVEPECDQDTHAEPDWSAAEQAELAGDGELIR